MDTLEYIVRLRGAAAAEAQVRGLAGSFKELEVSQHRAGGAAGALGGIFAKMAKGGALALAGIGFEAVKMSANFNHEMLRIRTDAGASTAELARMKTGVLDLASSGASMGQGPMSLAQGLYHLESLGQRGARALQALKLASQESAISGANLSDTTTAMGAAMYVGIKGTGNLTHLMGILNATVGSGNMRFQQLTEALGTGILPSAKVAGLGITDVSAALAVLTDAGYQASSAGAQLGTALHFLYAPSSKAKTALGDIGMTSTQMANDMHKPRGLLVALTDLRNHLDRLPGGLKGVAAAQTLNAILPGGRGRVLLTELTMLDRLRGKYEQINRISGGFAGSVAAQRQDPQTRLKTAEAGLSAGMIRFGDVLGPIVLPALTKLVELGSKVLAWLMQTPAHIRDVAHWFTSLGLIAVVLKGGVMAAWSALKALVNIGASVISFFVHSSGAAKALAAFLGILAAGFVTWRLVTLAMEAPMAAMIAAQWLLNTAMDANPIGVLIVGVAALTAGIIYAYHHSKTFRDILGTIGRVGSDAFNWIVGAVKDTIHWIGGAIAYIKHEWPYIVPVLTAPFTIVKGIVIGFVQDMIKALNWVIGGLNQAIDGINSATSSLPFGLGSGIQIGHIGTIGQIGGTTPAAAPTVSPNTGAPATGSSSQRGHQAGGSGATPTTVSRAGHQLQIVAHFSHPIILNGREIARANHRETVAAMAAGR